MCGIFAYVGENQNAPQIILDGLKSLEYRGYDSWGMAIKSTTGKIHSEKHIGKIGDSQPPRIISSIGIGHTRWATHGGVTVGNSHPHFDCKREVIIVHNGIVENFNDLKQSLLKKNHYFTSTTDTEIISHLIEDELKKQLTIKHAILSAYKQLQGLNAIIIFIPKNDEIYAVKSGSPLVFGCGKNGHEFFLASDYAALIPHTNQMSFLKDNELLLIHRRGYKSYTISGKNKKIIFLKTDYKNNSVEIGKYPHYMIKEIRQQPAVIRNLINMDKKPIVKLARIISQSNNICMLGCGSAYYAGLTGQYLFSIVNNRFIPAVIASEYKYLNNIRKDKNLTIALSQSGETIDIVAPLKTVNKENTKILAITNVLGSSLYRLADYKLLLNAGPEKCVLATKSFTAKLGLLHLLTYALKNDYQKGIELLSHAAVATDKIINNPILKIISQLLSQHKNIYVLGRGLSYPIALEAALKIKEVSYIHAEGFAAGELKHGVIALVEKGTPVIVFNPSDKTYDDTLVSAYEVKARGAYLIGIGNKPNTVYDKYIQVEDCESATIIPMIISVQLIAYYLALVKNLDPDKPRNLAKSVTVK